MSNNLDTLLEELQKSEINLLGLLSRIGKMQDDLMSQEGEIRKGLTRIMIERSRIKSVQESLAAS